MHVAMSAGSLLLAVASRGTMSADNGNRIGSNRIGGGGARPNNRKVPVPAASSASSSPQHQQRRRRRERGDGGASAVETNAKASHVVRRLSSRLAANRRKRGVLGSGGAARAALSTTESPDERSTTGDAELATLELLHGQIQAPQSPILSPEASTDYVGPAGIVNEFRDSAGNEFNVVLSNEDAPEVRKQKWRLRLNVLPSRGE